MPTLQEINEAAPDTPVFVLHFYARALLNQAVDLCTDLPALEITS
jgi:predicted amidohydrolase YtcJ